MGIPKHLDPGLRELSVKVERDRKNYFPLLNLLKNPAISFRLIQRKLGIKSPGYLRQRIAKFLLLHEANFPELHENRNLSEDIEYAIKIAKGRSGHSDSGRIPVPVKKIAEELWAELQNGGIREKPFAIQRTEQFLEEIRDLIKIVRAREM